MNKGSLIKETPSNKIIKGMIFAGCSFTWGQGLYYYSYLPSIVRPKPWEYDSSLVKETHLAHMKSVRFPRLVADYFNTFELTQPWNGGSNEKIVNWWEASLSSEPNTSNDKWDNAATKIDYSDISHLIFQFTQPHRCHITLLNQDNQPYEIQYWSVYERKYRDDFSKWLKNNNMTDIAEYQAYYIKKSNDKVKTFLQEVEKRGIKTVVFTWPAENLDYIKNDPWLSERFVNFKYNDITYDNIEALMRYNPELEIIRDTDNFENPPVDHHPSKKCHQVMADNIINHIKKM